MDPRAALKSMSIRKRNYWTHLELKALCVGIKRYGVGRWFTIINDTQIGSFLKHRTRLDLKDKYRNLSRRRNGSTRSIEDYIFGNMNVDEYINHVRDTSIEIYDKDKIDMSDDSKGSALLSSIDSLGPIDQDGNTDSDANTDADADAEVNADTEEMKIEKQSMIEPELFYFKYIVVFEMGKTCLANYESYHKQSETSCAATTTNKPKE